MSDRTKISAFVVCCNEQDNIGRCLASIAWCDELIVVDSGSTDKTLEISRKYTDKIIHNPWQGYREQKSFGLSQCTNEWVLNIDADEELSLQLIEEIQGLLSNPGRLNAYAGYELSRVVYYWKRWWRIGGWYPEYRMRFFKRALATWAGINPHERVLVAGPSMRLKGELYHYTYSNLEHQVRSLNNHSSTSAKHMPVARRNVSLLDLIGRPTVRFIKFYIIKQGFREGRVGFVVAVLESWSVFIKYAKLIELQEHNE